MSLKRVGILTGGGDCSGLNAVIRAITLSAISQHGTKVLGIQRGFEGLIFDRTEELTLSRVRDILPLGGTLLGASNKGDPFAYREFAADGSVITHDYSDKVLKNFKRLMLDCLFVVGGEGTLMIANEFHQRGMPIIAVPKTIDNDLEGTDYSFGYQTAVQVACDALDRLQTTGRSHFRVMILEVMGRDSGWIALESGIAGGAHVILIPEIPYDLSIVLKKIREREEEDDPFTIIVVAEGAVESGGRPIVSEEASTRLQGVPQLGGVGNHIAHQLGKEIDLEVRCTVLGHVQRGGTPISFDRVFGTPLGAFAMNAAVHQRFGHMVALKTPDLELIALDNLVGKVRQVPGDSQLIQTAESIGITFGR